MSASEKSEDPKTEVTEFAQSTESAQKYVEKMDEQKQIDGKDNPMISINETTRSHSPEEGMSDVGSNAYGRESSKARVLSVSDIEDLQLEFAERPRRSTTMALLIALGMLVLGMINGLSFAATGIESPVAIREQMVFKVWLVMKLFIAAVGTSLLAQAGLRLYNEEVFENSSYYRQQSVGYPRTLSGCFLLGVGMALAGGGPTMIPAQIGAGILSGPYQLVGGLVGALVIAVLEYFLVKNKNVCKKRGQITTLDQKFGIAYHKLAIPVGICFLAFAIVLEVVFTQKEDFPKLGLGTYTTYSYPVIAGVIYGLLQLPNRYLAGDSLGSTSSLSAVWATLTCGKLAPAQRVDTIEKSYQVLFAWVGGALGALVWTQSIHGFRRPEGYGPAYSIVGGFLQVFGARIAHGCTCGHGISGMSEFALESIFATCAIFGGAIATGFILVGAGEIAFP